MPLKYALKAGAPPKAAAPKSGAAKASSDATPSTVSGAIVMKAVAAGQQGAHSTTKAGVLKLKVGKNRPLSAELS
jgi:hypothetical protein